MPRSRRPARCRKRRSADGPPRHTRCRRHHAGKGTRFMIRALMLLGAVILATPAGAAQCGGDFNAFVAAMSREAAAGGISREVIGSAFAGVTQDPAVLAFDRRQRGTFRKSFEDYAATRITTGRISRGKQLLVRHAALLSRIERQFGVPP